MYQLYSQQYQYQWLFVHGHFFYVWELNATLKTSKLVHNHKVWATFEDQPACAGCQPPANVNNIAKSFHIPQEELQMLVLIVHHNSGSSQQHSIRESRGGEKINWWDKTPQRATN